MQQGAGQHFQQGTGAPNQHAGNTGTITNNMGLRTNTHPGSPQQQGGGYAGNVQQQQGGGYGGNVQQGGVGAGAGQQGAAGYPRGRGGPVRARGRLSVSTAPDPEAKRLSLGSDVYNNYSSNNNNNNNNNNNTGAMSPRSSVVPANQRGRGRGRGGFVSQRASYDTDMDGNGDWISSYLSETGFADTEADYLRRSTASDDCDRTRADSDNYPGNAVQKKPVTQEVEEEEVDDQTNLKFDEPESEMNVLYSENDNQLKAATFAKLVYKLTSSTTEIDITDFLLTYRSFSTPLLLLDALIQRYNTSDSFSEDIRKLIWLRLLNVLGKWIERFWYDFSTDETCPDKAMQFLNSVISGENTDAAKVAQGTRTKLERQIQNTQKQVFVHQVEKPSPLLPSNFDIPIIEFPSLEIARQLTLRHWNIWKAIKPWECLGLAWTKGDSAEKAPNVLKMTEHFNFISGWVVTTIVTCPDLKTRVKFCRKFLEICICLHRMGNFNGIMEIWSGMQRTPAYRLAKTWAAVTKEPKFEKVYNTLKTLTDSQKNFATMRDVIGNTDPPVIPYLGMYLSDLVFIEEGNQKRLGPNKLINYYKCRLVSASIKKIQQYQQKGYAFDEVKIMQEKIDRLVVLSDEAELFDISSYHEPKEGRAQPARPDCLDNYFAQVALAEEQAKTRKAESGIVEEVEIELVESDYPFAPVTRDSPANSKKGPDDEIVAVSLPKLIERVTNMSYQYLLIPFVATIPLLASPSEVFSLVNWRFNVPEPAQESDREMWKERIRSPITYRVVNLLRAWIAHGSFHEDETLRAHLTEFIGNLQAEDSLFVNTIESATKKAQAPIQFEIEVENVDLENACLLSWEPVDFAKQITLHVVEYLKPSLASLYQHTMCSSNNVGEKKTSSQNDFDILARLMNKDTGVEVKDRRKLFKSYPKSFIAGECVMWLKNNCGMTREESVAWCRVQQYAGVFENLSGKGEFECGEMFFRFAKGATGPSDPERERLKEVFTHEVGENVTELKRVSTEYLKKLQDFVRQEISESKKKSENAARTSIRRWVNVAQELEKLGNWHSLCAVVGGLFWCRTPEYRPYWDKVPDQSLQWFTTTRQLFTLPLPELVQQQLKVSSSVPYFAIFDHLQYLYKDLQPHPHFFQISVVYEMGELISLYARIPRAPIGLNQKPIALAYLRKNLN
eukprot:TRINITY_DN947_c0_g2_i1.p1 TRINITY_DN947_c0_g2~~TRINITY_DN947_c0_g2_i1.p1  ORF type:complete len:1349 (+),score=267.90 TRINITY_DN947_c0_g2_i1:516-4049(+)